MRIFLRKSNILSFSIVIYTCNRWTENAEYDRENCVRITEIGFLYLVLVTWSCFSIFLFPRHRYRLRIRDSELIALYLVILHPDDHFFEKCNHKDQPRRRVLSVLIDAALVSASFEFKTFSIHAHAHA